MLEQILKRRACSLLTGLASLIFGTSAWAYGIGQSTYPLGEDKRLLAAEFNGITSNGGGVGIQARLTQKLGQAVTMDGGLGISGGEHSSRIFLGSDFEIFPDYMNQPRFSIKPMWENVKEFDKRKNILSIAPVLSKGFSFWGQEAFPFVSVPVGMKLTDSTKTYQAIITGNVGISSKLPIENYEHITASVEAMIGITHAPTAFLLAFAFPMN